MAENPLSMGSEGAGEESDVYVTPPPKRPCTHDAAMNSEAGSDIVLTPPPRACDVNNIGGDEGTGTDTGTGSIAHANAVRHAARIKFLTLKSSLTRDPHGIDSVQLHALDAVAELLNKDCCSQKCLGNVDINLQYQRFVHLFAMDRESRNRVLYLELLSFAAKDGDGNYSFDRKIYPPGYKYR